MNRATTENIAAAQAAGLKDCSLNLIPAGGLLSEFFSKWDDIRKAAPGGYVEVNGMILYTDFDADVTYDDYCRFIFGQRPEEMAQERRKEVERIERELREFRRRIPEIYDDFTTSRAEGLIVPQDLPEWRCAVRHCLEGMYSDLCLRSALDIIRWLNDGDDFDQIRKKSDIYGHTGCSWGQTLGLVSRFGGVRGKSFFDYCYPNKTQSK